LTHRASAGTNLPRFLAGSALTTAVSLFVGLYTGRWDIGVVICLALVGVVLIVRELWSRVYRIFPSQDEEIENVHIMRWRLDNR
jgi:hypothetical protein